MSSLPRISSLWIGDRLSWLEQLCLKSFADAGHPTTLYSYTPIENLPAGVMAGDAADIFPAEPMLRHVRTGSPAIHADMWRLHLLKKTDDIWVDADMYCHAAFDFDTGYVFGWEKPGLVCNAVLGLPRGSATLDGLLAFFEDKYAIAPWLKPWQQQELQTAKDKGAPVHMTEQDWGFTGPASVTYFLEQTGEIAHARPQAAFYPVSFKDRNHMIKRRFKVAEQLGDDTYGVHFWARRMKPRLEEQEGNVPMRGSYMHGLLEKHGIDPYQAPIPPKPKSTALTYKEVIDVQGIKIPFVPEIITPKIEKPMRKGRYEGGECAQMRALLRPGDRVLEIGSGVGFLSAVAAKSPDIDAVVTVEANPGLIPMIKETHRINGVSNVEVINGVVSAEPAGTVDFYLRPDFWASSMEPHSRGFTRKIAVENHAIAALIDTYNPTVISCDIEGAELGLFDAADLSGVRCLILELHPKVYGDDAAQSIADVITGKGLAAAQGNLTGGTVKTFERPEAAPEPPLRFLPERTYRDWPVSDPRIVAVTCMKDEGPFILEWITWHQALGITDFVVFSNDCSDGTGAMLDALDDIGVVRHLPNPAPFVGQRNFQPVALDYMHHLKSVRRADFCISMDVDEFINVRTGDGTLADLFAATGAFDVLSISEINHGANGHLDFTDGWVKDLFPGHETEAPGPRKSRRGVKSIVRFGSGIHKIRNHRPNTDATVRWLDGSGRPLDSLRDDPSQNGIDVRGSYDLVSLDHFALRSLQSYLAKMKRGDVVVADKQVSQRYWRMRNSNDAETSRFDRLDPAARDAYRALLARAPHLADLHAASCAAHAAQISDLMDDPHYIERRDWILENCWDAG